jgi:hypothetical protein
MKIVEEREKDRQRVFERVVVREVCERERADRY